MAGEAGQNSALGQADTTAPSAPKPGKKKKLLLIVIALTLLALGGTAAAYIMLSNRSADPAQAAAKPPPKKKPVFVDLDTFTVNLRAPDDDRFLQVKLVAAVRDAASGEAMKAMMPAVRNEILLLLSSKIAEDLGSREGKEALANEIVVAANRLLAGTPAENAVEAVNFTHLIVQ